MESTTGSGPDPDEIMTWITATYPETIVTQAMGATCFSLDDQHWPNFATIVTTNEHDMGTPSDLGRPGVLRLSVGVGRATFERLTAANPDPDDAALDHQDQAPSGRGRSGDGRPPLEARRSGAWNPVSTRARHRVFTPSSPGT